MLDELHEECGVFGIYSPDGTDVVSACYYGLYALQHRGQQSCGIAVGDEGVIRSHKDIGLISEVFTPASLAELGSGQMAVAHCRYSAGGGRSASQPMVVRHIKGTMAIAHNGSLTNAVELRRELELLGGIFHTTADTEVIAYAITKERLNKPSIEAAVEGAMNILQGAYSMVVMSPQKLIAARDPMGFRPLCIGKLGNSTIISSESCALDAVGAEFVRDVEPGEIVVVDGSGIRSIKTHCNKGSAFCVFEFIYFARPDSVVEGASVHMARQRAGEFLAEEHPVDADVVIGVPDSGLDAAMGYARKSGIPYGMGFLKNKYIGRTFIAPTQKEREDDVRKKLNPIAATVRGKRVILVDDSIVRGTTGLKIVKLLREAGATEVHMRLSSPPFLYPCYFGTDIDKQDKLIAHNRTVEEIGEIMGVDSIGFLNVNYLDRIAEGTKCGYCTGCFTGKYPVPPPACAEGDVKYDKKLK
ncbi:MAG: amidophosphoribosyltransferase [Angelakisella sp.]